MDKFFQQDIASFNIWLLHEKRYSTHTARSYMTTLKSFASFYATEHQHPLDRHAFEDLKLDFLRHFLANRLKHKLSKVSNAQAISALKTFARFMHRHLSSPPQHSLYLIQRPRLSVGLPRALSISQAQDVLEWAKNTSTPHARFLYTALWSLMYGCGLRMQEALALRLKDVLPLIPSLETPYLAIEGKGQRQRLIPLLPAVHEAIVAYAHLVSDKILPHERLFRGLRGGPLHSSVARRRMAFIRLQLNLPPRASPHSLRHTFATHLLAQGASLRAIQELLGHTSLAATQIYTQVDQHHLIATYKKHHPRFRSPQEESQA